MATVVHARSWVLRMPLPSTHVVGRESFNTLIGVTFTDSDGVQGSGFSFVVENDGARAVKAMLDDVVIPETLGIPTVRRAGLWHRLMLATHRIGRGVSSLAIGAADTALWDLAARQQELSLADLVGRVRDDVPAYASGQFAPTLPVEEVIDIARREVERGLGAIKLRVGIDVRRDLDRVARLRETLGPTIRILCDANERLTLPEAIWFGRQLEQYDVYWLEEPLPAQDITAYRALAEAINIPIATGEHLQSVAEFAAFAQAGAAHVFQPDVGQIAGTTEFLRIAAVVRESGHALAPHFLPEVHIHLAAGFSNAAYIEQFPWADEWLTHPLRFADGKAQVPAVVGHGVEFTQEARSRFEVAQKEHHA
ncbi:mandelate racemase/muconate lactonizing enzyme family protein [uncultured Aeromicrobium sp.]|uniref:mandelate racemase/muconate lactonizing enzyme family protein n=1 Tax=uncultured Aeromicrobium sp. TaxID=337820 RepID=UPI0025F5718A|nr:mandelate racemase/muconate lactonizing enzyme family protein [uncultured Aeromicrobium sp.]